MFSNGLAARFRFFKVLEEPVRNLLKAIIRVF
jgi:hypothetical protein